MTVFDAMCLVERIDGITDRIRNEKVAFHIYEATHNDPHPVDETLFLLNEYRCLLLSMKCGGGQP